MSEEINPETIDSQHESDPIELDRRVFIGTASAAVASASWLGVTLRADAQGDLKTSLTPPDGGHENYAYDE